MSTSRISFTLLFHLEPKMLEHQWYLVPEDTIHLEASALEFLGKPLAIQSRSAPAFGENRNLGCSGKKGKTC
jgi:hypothetical protein